MQSGYTLFPADSSEECAYFTGLKLYDYGNKMSFQAPLDLKGADAEANIAVIGRSGNDLEV